MGELLEFMEQAVFKQFSHLDSTQSSPLTVSYSQVR